MMMTGFEVRPTVLVWIGWRCLSSYFKKTVSSRQRDLNFVPPKLQTHPHLLLLFLPSPPIEVKVWILWILFMSSREAWLQFTVLQRVWHNWSDLTCTHTNIWAPDPCLPPCPPQGACKNHLLPSLNSLIYHYLGAPRCTWDLSSPARDPTSIFCIARAESKTRDHQEGPFPHLFTISASQLYPISCQLISIFACFLEWRRERKPFLREKENSALRTQLSCTFHCHS